jgi:hypothetical protein
MNRTPLESRPRSRAITFLSPHRVAPPLSVCRTKSHHHFRFAPPSRTISYVSLHQAVPRLSFHPVTFVTPHQTSTSVAPHQAACFVSLHQTAPRLAFHITKSSRHRHHATPNRDFHRTSSIRPRSSRHTKPRRHHIPLAAPSRTTTFVSRHQVTVASSSRLAEPRRHFHVVRPRRAATQVTMSRRPFRIAAPSHAATHRATQTAPPLASHLTKSHRHLCRTATSHAATFVSHHQIALPRSSPNTTRYHFRLAAPNHVAHFVTKSRRQTFFSSFRFSTTEPRHLVSSRSH